MSPSESFVVYVNHPGPNNNVSYICLPALLHGCSHFVPAAAATESAFTRLALQLCDGRWTTTTGDSRADRQNYPLGAAVECMPFPPFVLIGSHCVCGCVVVVKN